MKWQRLVAENRNLSVVIDNVINFSSRVLCAI